MIDHERLELAIIRTAPEGPLQERPADLNFISQGSQIVVSGAPDDSAGARFDNHERAFRFHGTAEIRLEDLPLVTIAFRMLRPYQRVARRREKRVEIFSHERA